MPDDDILNKLFKGFDKTTLGELPKVETKTETSNKGGARFRTARKFIDGAEKVLNSFYVPGEATFRLQLDVPQVMQIKLLRKYHDYLSANYKLGIYPNTSDTLEEFTCNVLATGIHAVAIQAYEEYAKVKSFKEIIDNDT